jgi:hypothetical protein
VVRAAIVGRVVRVAVAAPAVKAAVIAAALVARAVAISAVPVPVPVARAASHGSGPMANRCPTSLVRPVRHVPIARRVLRRSRAWDPTASRCHPDAIAHARASRSVPMPMASDLMESLGIPSVARSVKPSVRPILLRAKASRNRT